MSETRGVFSLEEVIDQKAEGDYVPLDQVWHFPGPAPNTGYFGGGYPTVSTMDKVTYASDTTAAVPGAALSGAGYELAATGTTTHA